MLRKRYPSDEVAAKLREAEEMAAKGKTQREIARTLSVSPMTIHRWRKRRSERSDSSVIVSRTLDGISREQLELENSRLRRLVTDLLLEKIRLEDKLREERVKSG